MSNFDLEERTLTFAKEIILLCKQLPHDVINLKLIDQLIRSAGSIGANYREANDALGDKDFLMRMRIARKEAKETLYWLELLQYSNANLHVKIEPFFQEAIELKNILSAIIIKTMQK